MRRLRVPHGVLRVAAFALCATLLPVLAATPALAAPEVTSLTIVAPSSVTLGEPVTVQARLVGAAGTPIAGATVTFTTRFTFLNAGGDMVIAEEVTDRTGTATAEFAIRSTGEFVARATFRGTARYAPAQASAPLTVGGSRQLYAQEAGVRIPGLNEAPRIGQAMLGAPSAGILPLLARLWPGLSGWPIAATLLVIWSLYLFVVAQVFRVAGGAASEAGRRPDGGRAEAAPW